MVRIKAAVARKAGRKRIFKRAKGFFGHRKNRWVQAVRTVVKALKYATRDRKVRAREFRALWIARINAATKQNGLTYSRFMRGLKEAKVLLNRKMLSEIAIHDPEAFTKIVQIADKALPENVTRKKTTNK